MVGAGFEAGRGFAVVMAGTVRVYVAQGTCLGGARGHLVLGLSDL